MYGNWCGRRIFSFTKNIKILSVVYNIYVQLISFISLPFLMYFTPDSIQDGIHIVYSFLFIIIILNAASNPKSLLKFENKILNLLGSISYGIYMYHMIIVVLVVRLIHSYFGNLNDYLLNALYYSIAVLMTILVSWLSFTFLRDLFQARGRISQILSADLIQKRINDKRKIYRYNDFYFGVH